jgi:hypothetical protein
MPFAADLELLEALNSSTRLKILARCNIPHHAGSSAGEPVRIRVDCFPDGLPARYCVFVTPTLPCLAHVSSKTHSSFEVFLTPIKGRLPSGTIDVLVLA